MKRKICIVTGTRAEYGLLKPVMSAVKKNPKLRLQLIVTGMHLVPESGYTLREIENDGFDIDVKVDMLVANDTLSAMAKSVGLGIIGITQALEQLEPDILLVLGDRIEPLASAIAASIMNIPVAHIGGGQSTGSIDDSIRHAITKFAHIHFARTPLLAERLRKMGEEDWRIHTVGHVVLDAIFGGEVTPPDKIAEKYSLDLSAPILLAVFHSDTLNVEKSITQAVNLCEAIVELDEQTLFIYPNTDAGGREILKVIKEHANTPKTRIYANLPQVDYLGIMQIARLMLGNSSSGLLEAPVFKLPAVNIGDRQKGRDRLNNVVDVAGEREEIIEISKRILTDNEYRNKLQNCEATYGDGKAGETIAGILNRIEITPQLLEKKISY